MTLLSRFRTGIHPDFQLLRDVTHMRLTPLALLFVLPMIFTSGCRSYGGYESEEVIYRQTERMVQRFSEDLDRARGDVAALDQVASDDPRLALLAERLALLVEGQEAILDEQQSLLADLSPGSTYRSLHHAHGAIMAAQRTIRTQRAGLLRDASRSFAEDTLGQADGDRPYALIPPYYSRIAAGQGELTVSDVVRSARGDGARSMDPAAETSADESVPDAGDAQSLEPDTAADG